MNKYEYGEMERELIEFTQKVFNYYNGKINKVNNHVELCFSDNSYTGLCAFGATNHSLVEVYLDEIISKRDFDIYEIHDEIIYTIIHELYHCDQSIDNDLVVKFNDKYYINYMESSVDFMTISYIMNHLQEIEREFNHKVLPDEVRDKNYAYSIISNRWAENTCKGSIKYNRLNIEAYYKFIFDTYLQIKMGYNFDFSLYNDITLIINDCQYIIPIIRDREFIKDTSLLNHAISHIIFINSFRFNMDTIVEEGHLIIDYTVEIANNNPFIYSEKRNTPFTYTNKGRRDFNE